jgi:hypothetical protein
MAQRLHDPAVDFADLEPWQIDRIERMLVDRLVHWSWLSSRTSLAVPFGLVTTKVS